MNFPDGAGIWIGCPNRRVKRRLRENPGRADAYRGYERALSEKPHVLIDLIPP